MLRGLIPSGFLEPLLFLVLVGGFILIVVSVLRRRRIAARLPAAVFPGESPDVPSMPALETEIRVRATIRRIFRDTVQNAFLVEAAIGRRKFTFRPTDYEAGRYAKLVNQPTDFALFALTTLAPGGVEAMRDQIRDIDRVNLTPDLVRLVPAGQFANDHAVIGRVLSSRDALLDGEPVRVYRTQVVRQDDLTLVLELATERSPGEAPFADDTMVHGSARLLGYQVTD